MGSLVLMRGRVQESLLDMSEEEKRGVRIVLELVLYFKRVVRGSGLSVSGMTRIRYSVGDISDS